MHLLMKGFDKLKVSLGVTGKTENLLYPLWVSCLHEIITFSQSLGGTASKQ